MSENDWYNDEAFRNLSPEKMQFLMNFMGQKKSSNPRDMMALLMAFSGKAKGAGIEFSKNETDFIINRLMQNMSPQDRQKTELILRMMRRRG